MASNNRRRAANTPKRADAPLATEQYSELNATFYASGGPHEYIRARLQSIIFTLSDADEADTILAKGLDIGSLKGRSSMRMTREARLRYALMESTVLLHHAGESLLRLWLAHKDSQPCPWLSVASLVSAKTFKEEAEKYAAADTGHMSNDDIASIFLGGLTPEDAGIEMGQELWEDAVDGFRELLRIVAHRITGEANLYNAAKHGLVGVPADHGDFMVQDGIRIAGGAGITYLQKRPDDPTDHNGPRRWWATTSFTSLQTNVFLIELVIRAIHSLWNVARRKYAGFPGDLVLVSRDEGCAAVAIGPVGEKRLLEDFSQTLPTYNEESGTRQLAKGELHANLIRLGPDIFEAYDRINGTERSTTFIDLPLREADRRTPSTSTRHMFHFSPAGSSSL